MRKVLIKEEYTICPKCNSTRKIRYYRYICNKKECGFNPDEHIKESFCKWCNVRLGIIKEDLGCDYCTEDE